MTRLPHSKIRSPPNAGTVKPIGTPSRLQNFGHRHADSDSKTDSLGFRRRGGTGRTYSCNLDLPSISSETLKRQLLIVKICLISFAQ